MAWDFILISVLWGIAMKALIKPENEKELYISILFYVGLIFIFPYIVFLLLGGNKISK